MHNVLSVYFVKPLHVSGVTTDQQEEAYHKPVCYPGWGQTQPG